MRPTMTPTAAFVIAALWAGISIWGFTIPNTGFALGGLVVAVAFAGLGVYRLRRRPRRHD